MRNILIGFLLIFLDFSLNLGNSKIGFMPDFLGYIIIIKGLEEMVGESTLFAKAKPFAAGMAVYTGILYLLDLFGISVALGVLSYLLAFMSTAISLYISYNIVMGVIDMEGEHNTPLNGENLKSLWTAFAICNVVTFVSFLFPAITIICIIMSFLLAICFLVAFNNSKRMYYDSVR